MIHEGKGGGGGRGWRKRHEEGGNQEGKGGGKGGGGVACGKGHTQHEETRSDVRVLLSGEVRRRVSMWICRCDYAHLPRDVACRRCGCRQEKACDMVQQWWNDERLPRNWRRDLHPIALGTARKTEKGGKGKGKEGGGYREEPKREKYEKPPATRPKARAQPPTKHVDHAEEAVDENEQEEEGWQQGGLSAKQRKRARKTRDRRSQEEDEDMEHEGWKAEDEDEDELPRTQPIILPEVPRVTLVRRLETRKAELERARKEDEGGSLARKLERRIARLAEEVKISGGYTEKRQSFAIIDIEKNIVKAEAAWARAKEIVEERKQALQGAQREQDELRQKLDNLRKRLAHVVAQKAQEVTEQKEARALREAMASVQRLAGSSLSEEALLLLKHL